jgi:DNA modification methylase
MSGIGSAEPLYRTPKGIAYLGDSLSGMDEHLEDESVSLFFTSPPFALSRKKEYGNKPEDEYIDWFREFARVMWKKLREDGSLVIDLGGAWRKGSPTRSLYQFKLLLDLCENLDDPFQLAQEFYWYNPSKMPLPAQWVNVERCRVKDSVNVVWWLSKSDRPKADNRKVLTPYSASMERLLERQKYNDGTRPGGARVSKESWKRRHGGAIPPNVLNLPFVPPDADADWSNFLTIGGSESMSRYHRACNALKKHYADTEDESSRFKKHPARFPVQLPTFFIRLLTDKDDLVVDPFAGSNVTGQAAEEEGRRWQAFELNRPYLEPSIARFDAYFDGRFEWLDDSQPLLDAIGPEQLSA